MAASNRIGDDAVVRPGRRRDPRRDAEILDAALEVLAETGYDGMTMDQVAARARAGKATVYRRWPSKAHMVVDAVARMGQSEVDLESLPDTGTLRGDLTALIKPTALDEGARRLKVMAAVASMLNSQDDAALAESATVASSQPWIVANRVLIQRAVDRGEAAADTDAQLMATVIPGLCYFRVNVEGEPLDGDFIRNLIDTILLPALGIPPNPTPAHPPRRRTAARRPIARST